VQLIPVQKELAAQDVVARLEAAGTKLLITNAAMLSMAAEAVSSVGNIPLLDIAEKQDIFEGAEYKGFQINGGPESESTDGFLNRTSGSTGGKMKTVITTHAHFIVSQM
jgi:hypothetical protein